MLHVIKDLLTKEQLANIEDLLKSVEWEDGKKTAYGAAKKRKQNSQVVKSSKAMDSVNSIVHSALNSNFIIQHAVVPTYTIYPMLNKHTDGDFYGKHIDRPVRFLTKQDRYIRCDVSMTVFLSDPSEYEGGELVIYDGDIRHKIKLPKGHAVVYPSGFIHEVKPLISGQRVCAVTWMQSAISDHRKREILYDVVRLNNSLASKIDDADDLTLLSKIRNNLTREYCEF